MNSLKHFRTPLAVALLGAFAAQSAMACKAPREPRDIPDGQTARIEVMLEAKRTVDGYVRQVSDYMKCEKDGLKLQEAKARMTEVLAWFNTEVRAFKAVNSPALAGTSQ